MIDPLRTLADLLDGGRSPADALEMLSRAGAPPWAAAARAAMGHGGDAAGALVRAGALGPHEVQDLGGASAALDPAALRLVARRRAVDRAARQGALRALILPGLGTLTTAATGLWIPRDVMARLIDVLPLGLVVAGVVLAARPAWAARLRPLAGRLPGRGHDRQATLHGLWAAAPLDAAGFARAARLLPAGPVARACQRTARRLEQGDTTGQALPAAAEIGAEAAGAILAGVADPGALDAAVEAADRAAIGRWVFVARLLGWATLFFITIRLMAGLFSADLGGIDGLQNLLPGGVDTKAMEELMRELQP